MIDLQGWAKTAVELAAAGKTIELNGHVIALQSELLDLREQNLDLKRQLELTGSARRENGIVYFGDDPTPFCGTCYGKDRTHQIPLIDDPYNTDLFCSNCKATPPKPGAGRRPTGDEGGYPVQPGDNILKGGHTVMEFPLDWPGPNAEDQ